MRNPIKLLAQKVLGGPLRNSTGTVAHRLSGTQYNPQKQLTGITYKAIDKVGQTISVYSPQAVKANGDAYVNHPLITLARKPNPRQNSADFHHLWGMLMEIYGETFWYLARGESTKRVKEVYLLDPSKIELKISEGELVGYVLHKNNGEQVPFLPEEIVHDKRPNPFNEWRGLSVLEKASVYVDTEINTSHFTLNYIKNNASPSGIVSTPDMESETFKAFVRQWREGYEGPENAGKTAFIRGGEAKFQAVGATLKDIELEKVRNMSKDDVLMMLDMPKAMLGMIDEKGFNRASVETLKLIFAESKLEPMMNRLDMIWEQIGVSFGREGVIDVQHESPVPEDREFLHKVHTDLLNRAITVNEVRKELDLEPLPDGDELMPQNIVTPTEQKSVKIVAKKKVTEAMKQKTIRDEQETFRKELVEVTDIYARKIKNIMSDFAGDQEDRIINKINATSKTFEEWLFNIKEESEVLAALLSPVIIQLMETQAEEVSNFVSGELFTISTEQRQIASSQILRVVGVFNEDTLRKLEKTLVEGQTDGESLAKLKKRVNEVYSDAKGYRAERIARTESLRTSNKTAEMVYKENGYNKVEWFINPGACEFCQTFSGRTKEIGTKYEPVGSVVTGASGGQLRIEYDDIDTPPLHPNCTCSLIPAE